MAKQAKHRPDPVPHETFPKILNLESELGDEVPEKAKSLNDEERTLGQFIPLEYHYNMLQDEARVGAFRDAINLIVKPGMHVVELGGGTGILSSLAARKGAMVTCVERNPILVEHARKFVHANHLEHRIEVVREDATRFVPDRPVDAVVCEMLHVGLLREKQTNVIESFKANYLQQFGDPLPEFLPNTSILLAQPIQQDFSFEGYCAPVPLFQAPIEHQPRTIQVAGLQPYSYSVYGESLPRRFRVLQNHVADLRATVNAVRLATQNAVAINLQRQSAINWANQCLVVPLENPFDVEQGDPIELFFDYESGASIEDFTASLRVHRVSRKQELAA